MIEISQKAKPFLKWAGGKQSLAKTLVKHFPRNIDTYYEPFLGGGSVFFELQPQKAILGDYNSWLIETYATLKTDHTSILPYLDNMKNTKQKYLYYRSIDPNELSNIEKAAHLIYLNKTCFRGLFRVNRKGKFNVPYGNYDRRYYDRDNLRNVANDLQNVEFRCGDFELNIDGIQEDDFVYFDPPYYKLGGFADFNRYTENQFRAKDHIRLASLCHELDKRNIKWAVSNSNTKFVRYLFENFCITQIANRRDINLNAKNRTVDELLITNYPIDNITT